MNGEHFPHLADIGFKRFRPAPALRPYVQCYWVIRSNGRLPTRREEFMHADGGTGLIFNFGDVLQMDTGHVLQSFALDRTSNVSRKIILAGHIKAIGINFKPGGVYPFFGIPMNELVDTAVLTDHLPTNQLSYLHEKIHKASPTAEKVFLIETWLLNQLRQVGQLSSVIQPSLAMIAGNQGQISVQAVADAVHISVRQLERLYKTQVGLSPKKVARIVRVRQTREALKQNKLQSPVDIAYEAGFYDQAHFIREFKSVVGMTPVAYARRRN